MNLHNLKPKPKNWSVKMPEGTYPGRFMRPFWERFVQEPDLWNLDSIRIALTDNNISVGPGDRVTIMGREIIL